MLGHIVEKRERRFLFLPQNCETRGHRSLIYLCTFFDAAPLSASPFHDIRFASYPRTCMHPWENFGGISGLLLA